MFLPSLKELREKVNQSVIGQVELVDKVTLCIYRHLYKIYGQAIGSLGPSNNNLLIIGKTGTGKTFSVRETARHLSIPFVEINSKSICLDGYKGKTLASLLELGFKDIQHESNRE